MTSDPEKVSHPKQIVAESHKYKYRQNSQRKNGGLTYDTTAQQNTHYQVSGGNEWVSFFICKAHPDYKTQ